MRPTRFISFGLIAAIAGTVLAVEIKLPEEKVRLIESSLPGYPLAMAHCSTCHSPDYVRMQPPSSLTYWKSSVVKMQKTFGAPIPDDTVEPIAEYLARTYGTERGRSVAPPPKSAASPKSSK